MAIYTKFCQCVYIAINTVNRSYEIKYNLVIINYHMTVSR